MKATILASAALLVLSGVAIAQVARVPDPKPAGPGPGPAANASSDGDDAPLNATSGNADNAEDPGKPS